MTDFIPGEGYRLDVIDANDNVLVDSWAGQLKADLVATDGTIIVDTETGKIYGSFIGDIEDIDGTTIFDYNLKELTANLKGDVYNAAGDIVLDTDLSQFTGDVIGNVYATDGERIVDSGSKVISADRVYGDFYGDLTGTLTSESTIFGTFTGDFNGNAYGEFFGDFTGNSTGTHTGDVNGNLTGNVTGNLIGEVMVDADTSLMAPPNAQHNQWNWLGGIGHPVAPPEDAVARGPILVLESTRDYSALRAHVQHYDGTNVVTLDITGQSSHKAVFHGRLDGPVVDADNETILDSITRDTIKETTLLGDEVTLQAERVTTKSDLIQSYSAVQANQAQHVHHVYRGSFENRTAIQTGDLGGSHSVYFWDGDDYKLGGAWGFIAREHQDQTNSFYPTGFGISLSDGVSQPSITDGKSLRFDEKGVLSVKVMQARGTSFAERDSMTAEPGMIIYNTNNGKFQGYTATGWVDLH
jgi:flagellar hook assembly protein FlgD